MQRLGEHGLGRPLVQIPFAAFFAAFTVGITVAGCQLEATPEILTVSSDVSVGVTVDLEATRTLPSPHVDLAISKRVMVLENLCDIPDPAIDASHDTRTLPFLPIVTEIHAGLTTIAEDGSDQTEPDLAQSWSTRDGGGTYEFLLRRDLKFSDGSPLTALDVKWSWERALRMGLPNGVARSVFGGISGASDVVSGNSDDLVGVKAVDDRTLSIELDRPTARFPMLLANPVASVLKRENVQEWPVRWTNQRVSAGEAAPVDEQHSDRLRYEDFSPETLPVGAGPFKLETFRQFDPSSGCAVVRNEHYWGTPAELDAVAFGVNALTIGSDHFREIEGDPGGRFTNGLTDAQWLAPESARGDDAAVLLEETGARIQTPKSVPYTMFITFNPSVPPFDDPEFRRALNHSSDLNAVYEVPVQWDAVLVPPRLTASRLSTDPVRRDEKLAVSSLARSEYSERGHEFQFTLYSGFDIFHGERLGRLFAGWEEFSGMQVKLVVEQDPERLKELRATENNAIRWFEVQPIYPDPYAVLHVFENPFGPGSGDPEVVRRIRTAQSESDMVNRLRLFGEAEQYILNESLALPLLVDWRDSEMVIQPWVHDFDLKRFGGSVFHDVWFDESAPERVLPQQ